MQQQTCAWASFGTVTEGMFDRVADWLLGLRRTITVWLDDTGNTCSTMDAKLKFDFVISIYIYIYIYKQINRELTVCDRWEPMTTVLPRCTTNTRNQCWLGILALRMAGVRTSQFLVRDWWEPMTTVLPCCTTNTHDQCWLGILASRMAGARTSQFPVSLLC